MVRFSESSKDFSIWCAFILFSPKFFKELIRRFRKCWPLLILLVLNILYLLLQDIIYNFLKPFIFKNKNQKENLNYYVEESSWKHNDLPNYDFKTNKNFSVIQKAYYTNDKETKSFVSAEERV